MIYAYEALKLAKELHAGQVDKAGFPYGDHLERVQDALAAAGAVREVLVAAALHDVLEDKKANSLDLFNAGVDPISLELIHALTRREGEDYSAYIARVEKAGASAVAIKLADLHDNLNPLRLQLLPFADRKRLHLKYTSAMRYLLDIGAC